MFGTRNATAITLGKASCDEGPEDPGGCSPVLASDSRIYRNHFLQPIDGWIMGIMTMLVTWSGLLQPAVPLLAMSLAR